MGIFWRSTMPLLSTLAALVIIVHSAEEQLDPGFRRELRPRAVAPGTNSYEQPWKAIDAEPLSQQSTHAEELDEISGEELIARRRPVRKRKRRPQTSAELEPEGRYREGPAGPYPDTDYHDSYQTSESPRRRRKRPDGRPYRWADERPETERERPLRRRGLRRKRPTFDTNPQLSEFNYWNQNENQEETDQIDDYYPEEKIRKEKEYLDGVPPSNADYNIKVDESKEDVQTITDQTKISVYNEMHVFNNDNKNFRHWNVQPSSEDRVKSEEKIFNHDKDQYTTNTYTEHTYAYTENEDTNPRLSEFSMDILYPKSSENSNIDGVNQNSKKVGNTLTNNGLAITKKAKRRTKNIWHIDIIMNSSKNKTLRNVRISKSLLRNENFNYTLKSGCHKINVTKEVCDKLIATLKRAVYWYPKKYNDSSVRYTRFRIEKSSRCDGICQIHEPIDPYTLKQILKKSNGTSLSEILQRHNLSLSDLLHGRGEAILALNKDPSPEDQVDESHNLQKAESQYHSKQTTIKQENTTPMNNATDVESTQTDIQVAENEDIKSNTAGRRQNVSLMKHGEIIDQPLAVGKRRFPTGIRRKLRMRPMLNSTVKAQLGRELIALSARKYSNNNKTLSKSKEWKDVLPMMINQSIPNDDTSRDDTTEPMSTTTETSVDTTMPDIEIVNSSVSLNITENSNALDNEVENTKISTTEPTTTITIEILPSEIKNETEKPKVSPIMRHGMNNSVLRRQAFNYRLKRKRLKHKSSTTENPNDDLTKKMFGMANLVSASEFIERTQKPHTTVTQENTELATELEDFMTTPVSTTVGNRVKSTRITTSRYTTPSMNRSPSTSTPTSTTEQTAKFEIEEILNDSMTSERLERILRERNMTLTELVMHRERGSSHVHLADIFHNASKEPNPPEPFLTKSSIEPISKETYPLRAILEANIHDTTVKTPTVDTTKDRANNVHIPVVMDFGSNVNENGENMGIISLFNKFAEKDESVEKTELRKDSNGLPYLSTIVNVNATHTNDTNRESRLLGDEDLDSWNVLLTLMTNHDLNDTKENAAAGIQDKTKTSGEEDLDGDGLIILEDLQHLKDFDSNIATASDEKIEIKMIESNEKIMDGPGILNRLPNTTRSVAIATASILGLATILFLLTYIALKYKQQRSPRRKKDSFCDDRIPTPVFEHRKGHKNHCSSRSISPMISNSNIYTMSTLDSHNGKESPDYMWNSLRKPFQ